jgi:hypothetical protein
LFHTYNSLHSSSLQAAEAIRAIQHPHAVAEAQDENQSLSEVAQKPALEKQQHEGSAKEQARQQGLALQRCGS